MQIDNDIMTLIECKKLVDGTKIDYTAPAPGKKISIQLYAPDIPKDRFFLDVSEGARSSAISLSILPGRKTSLQTRDSSLPLVRVDIGEHLAHTNPDGTVLKGSHVHIAHTRYGACVAYPLASEAGIMVAGADTSIIGVFESFRAFCNIDPNLTLQWTFGF